MAESKQNLEEVLTCSVCVQMFREPVVLPCQHSFCKECIRFVAEKSKCGQRHEEGASSAESEEVYHLLHCPVCRAPVTLGKDGVAGLPVNFQLAEIVERYSSDAKFEDNILRCAVCCDEDNSKSKAVKYCCYCRLLYCEDCLSAYHPMKGTLKQHRLVPIEQYVSQENLNGQVMADSQSSCLSVCETHDQALSLYCMSCRMILCLRCVFEHPEHKIRDIVSATEKEKAAFLDKTGGLGKCLKEIKRCLSGFKGIQNNIQENHDLHTKAVQSAYSSALEELDTWKASALETVKSRHSDWSVQCGASVKHLSILEEELERMQQASKELLCSTDVKFLQGSKELTQRIDDQFSEVARSLEKHKGIKEQLVQSLGRESVVRRHVVVRETAEEHRSMENGGEEHLSPLQVTKTQLMFTETNDEQLIITHNGSVAECEDLLARAGWSTALTDGRYQTGWLYWEFDISVIPPSPHSYCYSCVGAVQQGCDLSSKPGTNSWHVVIEYREDEVRYYSPCGGEVQPAYQKWSPHQVPRHLGLCLNCDDKSLTVLDRANNQLIYQFRDLKFTEPLIPAVGFCMVKSASARLITRESVDITQLLSTRLNIE